MIFIVKTVFVPLKIHLIVKKLYAKVNTENNTVTILSKKQYSAKELINTLSKVGYTSKEL